MKLRKITVGPDYKSGMNYIVGQEVIGGSHKISSIERDDEGGFLIYVVDDLGSERLWKGTTPSVPVHFENDINY